MENCKLHFEEDSCLVRGDSLTITPAEASLIGAACAKAAANTGNSRLLVCHGSNEGAAALAHAFASGAAASGADCIMAGRTAAGSGVYAGKSYGCGIICHIHTEITAVFRLFAGDGLPLYRSTEEHIEKLLRASGGISSLPYSHFGSITAVSGTDGLYIAQLEKKLPDKFKGVYADVYSSSREILSLAEKILESRNDRSGERIAFRISGDGRKLSAYTEKDGYVFRDRLEMICRKALFEKGIDAAVCGRSARVLEKMAADYGRRVISCGGAVCRNENAPSEKCLAARRAAAEQSFAYDGAALMLTVLEILSSRGITLGEAAAEIPSYSNVSRYIPVSSPSELLKRLCSTGNSLSPDGVLSDGEGGRVVIRPVRTGKGIMLDVESYAMEAASELCDFYSEVIKRNMQ